MFDKRFGYGRRGDRTGYATQYPRYRHADSLDDLYSQWLEDVREAETIRGGQLSDKELRHGVERPSDPAELREQARRHALERNPPQPEKSPELLKVEMLASKVEAERRAKLSPAESALEDARKELAAREQSDAREAAAVKIMQTGGYKQVRAAIDEALFRARFDPTIPATLWAEMRHQLALLETRLDVGATKANLVMVRKSIADGLESQRLALKQQQDALAAREALLKVGPWDDLVPEVVGATEYVALTRGDRTVKISKARFDARASDDSLTAELFPETSNA